MKCRHCKSELEHIFLNLGIMPLANAYLSKNDLNKPEKKIPLKVLVCHKCWLVQTDDCTKCNEIFTDDYAYFSSVSSSWLEHAAKYTSMIKQKLNLNRDSFVLEIASNDGYLLQNFIHAQIPCLGIEPTNSTADVAEELGIQVIREFFDNALAERLTKENKQADLIIGNNVFAHVPDIDDFTKGLKTVLKKQGTITLEFPHLLNLVKFKEFDTIYHEHYSYLSLLSVSEIFKSADLKVYDVEELPTHGGSLRVYGCHSDDPRQITSNVANLIKKEIDFGLQDLSFYLSFQNEADKIVVNFLNFLKEQKNNGKKIGAYGAAAKGNTLLNYAKIDKNLIPYVCDAAPSKQGKFLPGSHIPIHHPDYLMESKPDWLVIIPWNLEKEITEQQAQIREWGGKFVVPIPELKILE